MARKLRFKDMDKEYLINHIVEMATRADIEHSTINFKTMRHFSMRGSELIGSEYNYILDFYPFVKTKMYNALEIKFKNHSKDRSRILLLQERGSKHILFLHLYDRGKKISVADFGKWIIRQEDMEDTDKDVIYTVKRIKRLNRGDSI